MKPKIGKYYQLETCIIIVRDVSSDNYTYSYVNHPNIDCKSEFIWKLSFFKEEEVTELMQALL